MQYVYLCIKHVYEAYDIKIWIIWIFNKKYIIESQLYKKFEESKIKNNKCNYMHMINF